MNSILLPYFSLIWLLTTINCEHENKFVKSGLLSHEKSKVIEKHDYNDYLISDTLKITNTSLIINLKNNHFSYRSFNKNENKRINKLISETQFDDSVVEHKFLTFYSSRQDSVRFFLREKKFPTMLNSKLTSNSLNYDSSIQLGMSKQEFIQTLKNIYYSEKENKPNRKDGFSINELRKVLEINLIPNTLGISDSFFSGSFFFSFENDKLHLIEYQVYYWE